MFNVVLSVYKFLKRFLETLIYIKIIRLDGIRSGI